MLQILHSRVDSPLYSFLCSGYSLSTLSLVFIIEHKLYIYTLYVFNTKKRDRLYSPHLIVNFYIFVCGHWFSIYHDIIKNKLLGHFAKSLRNAFMFLVLQIPAFRVPGFTDSGFSCSWFYRFRLFVFLVLQIPAFRVPGFTDSGFSCSWFYRFRLFVFLVLQIPAFRVPGFTDSGFSCSWFSRSVPRSFPRFPVPCFTDSRRVITFSRRERL